MLQEEFRQACARYATGVTVATVTDSGGRPHGLTATSFSSVSWAPPMVLVCVAHSASAYRPFLRAEAFAVNILGEEQRELSARFAGPAEGRFEGVEWRPGAATGAPLIGGALAWLECRATHRVDAGDHTVFIGEVAAAASRDGQPLLYFQRDYRAIGGA